MASKGGAAGSGIFKTARASASGNKSGAAKGPANRPSRGGTGIDVSFLKQLCDTPGVPGREERIIDLVRDYTAGWWDEEYVDPMGNFLGFVGAARKPGRSQREKSVAIACHLDQIGFYVRYIDDEGFLRVQAAGGFDTRNLFARRVRVLTASGDLVGIMNPGTKPVHIATAEERKKIPEMSEMVIDLCLPKEECKRLVRPGDPVVLEQNTVEIGDYVCGQAMDNRISPFIALNAIEAARGKNTYDIWFIGAAQEEVGLRGAQVAAQQIDAEVGIGIDVTLAVDTPGIEKSESITRLGDGVAIKVMDSSMISNRSLFEDFVALAERKKIRYQYELLPLGGTDGAALQRFGRSRRAITLSLPCRYIHTVVETVNKADLQASIDLLAAWLRGE
jgi:putative aminopeptidase FrvX